MNSGRYYHHQSSGNGVGGRGWGRGGWRRAEDDGGGGGGRHFSGRGRGRGRSAEAAARGAPPRGGGGGRAGRRRPDIGPGHPRRPLVLLLVGIPGSGKSHFASRLEAESSNHHHGGSSSSSHGMGRRRTTARLFVRVNQDALGSRRRCEDVARSALAGGGGNDDDASSVVVIIDRCNFDADQRRTWIDMAHEMEADVECVIFDYDRDVCIERCQRRRGHETIRPSEAAMIVSRMAGSFRPPVPLPPPPSRDYDDEDGSGVRCRGGERFRRLSRVSSFRTSDDLVEYYLGR